MLKVPNFVTFMCFYCYRQGDFVISQVNGGITCKSRDREVFSEKSGEEK